MLTPSSTYSPLYLCISPTSPSIGLSIFLCFINNFSLFISSTILFSLTTRYFYFIINNIYLTLCGFQLIPFSLRNLYLTAQRSDPALKHQCLVLFGIEFRFRASTVSTQEHERASGLFRQSSGDRQRISVRRARLRFSRAASRVWRPVPL